MARDHARIHVAIWNDEDFRALPLAAQHVYLAIISQPRLSYCGVLDYFPGRLAALSVDNTAAKVRGSIRSLEKARFISVDKQTNELAVRTYVKHDGVMHRENMGKAMGAALERVVSGRIKTVIRDELSRLYADNPSLAGWVGFKANYPAEFDMASGMAFAMQLPMPLGEE